MKVLLAGGGTAGHINPAVAIANEIKRREGEAKIAFVGTPRGMENELVAKAGYPLYHMDVRGFQRKELWKNFETVRCLFKSLRQADEILDEFQPDLVIGTGGYVSGPLLYRAAKRGIKTAIHEQNAFPGVTSKILQHYVDRVMLSFEESRSYFKKQEKLVLTGNPVRRAFFETDRDGARKTFAPDGRPLVFSVGGSLGAAKLNESICDFILENSRDDRFYHIHSAGKSGYGPLCQKLRDAGFDPKAHPNIRIVEYVDQMAAVMAACDLMVCRCGAITLSEVEALGKAAILIPSPNVTGNHQYFNAMALVKQNAGVILEEKDLTPQALRIRILQLMEQPSRLLEMGCNARRMSLDDSSGKIYEIVTSL